MIKVKFYYREKGEKASPDPDEVTVSSLETAEQEIKNIIEEFNRVEKVRYGDKGRPREFVKLVEKSKPILQHNWSKIGIYHGATVPYRCSNCKLERDYHFSNVPIGGDCYPERVCEYCKKEFKTEKGKERHTLKMHEGE